MKNNFKNAESLRQTLINKAPKYGNDDPVADGLAKEINDFWTKRVSERTAPFTGRKFRAGLLSWNYWILYATRVSATPDGRKRGTYLSDGVCPVTGADRQGPTAVSRSVAHIGLEQVPNGGSHTITLNPSVIRNPEQRTKIRAFLRGYTKEGGSA